MSKYVKYSNVDYVMPFMFTNDIWNLVLYELLKDEKNPIKDIYGSVYCAWQSGRHSKVHQNDLNILENYLKNVNKLGLIPNFTFSSLHIDYEKLNDDFSNELLDLAYNYNSYFIVSSDKLYNHIKKRYNNAKMVCSVILPSTNIHKPNFNETRFYKEMLDKYDFVVIRPEYAIDNIDNLSELIPDISRVEVLVNQNCVYNCPNHAKHYFLQEKNDKLYNSSHTNKYIEPIFDENIAMFCPHNNLKNEKKHIVRMNLQQVDKLLEQGVKKIKLQGRDGNYQSIFNDLYEFFFDNNLSKNELKIKIDDILSNVVLSNRTIQYLYLTSSTFE